MRNANPSLPQRSLLAGGNALKIGLFGANCSSGRAVTKVPERWSGTWTDNLRLAKMADEAGIDFLLPIGRWKGYGGDTGYQEATLETVTWATGLLAATKNITVFGTVHAPLFHPIIAAKQMVTADHVGEGRFGLNIVVGWNEGEFEMFGVQQREHATRYEYAQEWIDAIKMMWSERNDFDFDGKFIKLKNVRAKPELLALCQQVFGLPSTFGHNWDALADSVEDFSWRPAPGYVVLVRHGGAFARSSPENFATALEILAAAATYWAGKRRVFVALLDDDTRGARKFRALPR